MAKINERIALAEQAAKTSEKEADRKDDDHQDDDQGPGLPNADKEENKTSAVTDSEEFNPNRGILILDATCTPADIKYPTDLGLLNESREKLG